ncbi:MAG: phosphoribosylglycinamide formyltransferase [Chitinophagaceae bacterium]
MFQRLQKKWKVNGTQLFLILCVFAITGTTTAYITRQVTTWCQVQTYSWAYWLLKIAILIFGYQVLILLIAIPFGQFSFFWKYEKKILARLGLIKKETNNNGTNNKEQIMQAGKGTVNIAIFASGAGSNAQKIIDHFRNDINIKVALIVCNKPNAGVLDIAVREHIPYILIEKEQFFRGNGYVDELHNYHIDLVVLAGFLWKVPVSLVNAYSGSIVNIHPALLPAYGGKGMYGAHVHNAVIEAGDKESGITIHYVDELYDNGKIILQERCTIEPGDTPETLAAKIHTLEHAHYPLVIEKICRELQNRR